MKAIEAIDRLDAEKWRTISAEKKLELLKQIRQRLGEHIDELAKADCDTRNIKLDDKEYRYQAAIGYAGTAGPVGSTINATIDLYEKLVKGEMLRPISMEKVRDDLYEIHVFPMTAKDKIMYQDRKDYLRVKGEPKQINPMDKPGGIIGVLGAGNYSSSIEMINGLFLENCAVVHKPHHLNAETDKVWEKIMKPLVDYKALSFCDAEEGRNLVADERLTKIYFTGGTSTAQAIMSSTDTELISECGGNNPCIIVPGDEPWTEKQLQHQTMHIATWSKANGGAVCGRPQSIVTCKNWPQREQFLKELENALENETPAATSYYPGSEEVAGAFKENHPDAKVLKPEEGKFPNSEYLFITGVAEDSYAVKNEAFCQITDEVALDTPAKADEFLPKAVEFCNTKLHGTLGSSILIDDKTLKNHQKVLTKAVTDMEYGAVGVNTMPPMIWMNPYLTWSGNEEGKEFVSGIGNFGNLLDFENVEKSIAYSNFISPGHMMSTNKGAWYKMFKQMAMYAADPSWMRLSKLTATALAGRFKHKDF